MGRMLRLFLFLALALVGSTAQAGYHWVQYSPGYFTWAINDDGSNNDGYIYTQSCYCGRYSYSQWGPISAVSPGYSQPQQQSLSYSKYTWKERGLDHLAEAKDTESFLQFCRENNLAVNPASLPGALPMGSNRYGNPYASSAGGQPAYGMNNYSVSQQGFAQTGNTVYGNGGYSQGARPDVDELIHHQERLLERQNELGQMANNNVTANVHLRVEGDVEVAKINAATEGFLATLRAAQTPKTEIHSSQVVPYAPQPMPLNPSQPDQPQPAFVPAQAGPMYTGPVTLGVAADVAFRKNCGQCHGPQLKKGNLDLLSWQGWDAGHRADMYGKKHGLLDRLTTKDASIQMPPPGSPQPTPEEVKTMLAAVAPPQQQGANNPGPMNPPAAPILTH